MDPTRRSRQVALTIAIMAALTTILLFWVGWMIWGALDTAQTRPRAGRFRHSLVTAAETLSVTDPQR